MADIPEVMSGDPTELLGVGRRHLAVRDYSSAVSCLGKACELLALKYGQQADECGEAYLWYGKSLLGLAREESGVLGDGIPQGGEGDEDEGEDGAEDENDVEMNGEDEAKKTEDSEEAADEDSSKMEPAEEEAKDDKEAEPGSSAEAGASSNADDEVPGGSGECSKNNGEENVEEDEDDVENLQVAWEVLELARDIFVKRGDNGRKELADVFYHLGEVSLESETYDKAVTDMSKSLEIFKELYGADDRRIAETHYQIGLAHSLSNGFDDAISNFKTAADILNARIKTLESPTANEDATVKKYLSSDAFYSIEGEVKELKELLPEIQEKIQDMIDYKTEAIRSVKESLGLSVNGESSSKSNGHSNGAETEKKASDISHLVKRKRKPSDETPTEDSSASKKLAQ